MKKLQHIFHSKSPTCALRLFCITSIKSAEPYDSRYKSWHMTFFASDISIKALFSRVQVPPSKCMISVMSPLRLWGVCMADGIAELWRVRWRPSTSSITRWWTWEAGPWQVGGDVGGVKGTNGVKDGAQKDSWLLQQGLLEEGRGGEGGWWRKVCPGLRSGMYDRRVGDPRLA